ncbi:phage head closure protein [Virgibacillus sp. AGTR]|uniref:phage head closure protein n=1 Tax=Virgibacillus sp. AGTR TaxID=2812055 RepID=UPI001D168F23|nr:phage head closure protein [Virgibacillus sp. AGTR]MCC2248855.1 phage head closure protein [Virgibacillus sp. AGTR]
MNKMNFDFSKLNQPIIIYELKTDSDNGMPSKPRKVVFHECFAHVESISLKDYETSVQTGTQHNMKVFIRNYPGITNKMTITHNNQDYNIEQILTNYRQSGFTVLIAKEVSNA